MSGMEKKCVTLAVQFLKFSIIGIGNGIVYFVLYYLLLRAGISYLLANTLAWMGSVFNSYCWNRRYVFSARSEWWKVLWKTYVSYGVSFVIGLILLFLFVERIGISEIWAPWGVTIVTVPLNFFLNKFWAFAK